MKRLFFLDNKIQFENLGDLAINKMLIHALRPHGRVIFNDREVPALFLEELELREEEHLSRSGRTFKTTLRKSLMDRKAAVHLVRTPGHRNNGFGLLTPAPLLLNCLRFFLYSRLGCRIILLGASVGPFHPRARIFERFMRSCMSAYTLRDSLSLVHAREAGIKPVRCCPDLAFLLEPPLRGQEPRGIVFSFRETDDEKLLRQTCLNLAATLAPAGPVTFAVQVDRDLPLNTRLARALTEQGLSAQVADCGGRLQHSLTLYARNRLVFSNRLHVLLFALMAGSLPLIMNGGAKITGLFKDLSLDELIRTPRTLPDSRTIHQLEQTLAQRRGPLLDEMRRRVRSEITLAVGDGPTAAP